MKQRCTNSLITATFADSAAALLGLLLSSLAGLYIASVLSKSGYGRMTFFASWFPPMLLILGLGLSAKVIKDIAEPHQLAQAEEWRQRLLTLLVLRVATLAPLPLIGLLAWLISAQFPFMLVALAATSAVFNDFLLGILRGHGRLL